MKNRKQNIGIGNWHKNKAYEAKWKILIALSDGQWHRYMELKQKTELSSRTLTKHLDHMKNIQIIEKKADIESGEYPYPVFYKATPELKIYVNATITRKKVLNGLEPAVNQSKDPLIVLDGIHAVSQLGFLDLLTYIQQNNIKTNEPAINFFAEIAIWGYYKQYIYKLINASRKIVNDLNITQLLINQAKRQIEIYEKALQIYEKMEQKNAVPSKNATQYLSS